MLRKITFSIGIVLILLSGILAMNASTNILAALAATSPTATPMPEPIISPTPSPANVPTPSGSPEPSPNGQDPSAPKAPKPVQTPFPEA